jgi:DNA repair photolyase
VPVLRAELSRRSWSRDPVVVGAATDPYQPAEGHYRLTRGCLQALHDHRTPVQIITRGPMIVRDVDVLTALSRRVRVMVCMSIPSLDMDVVQRTEPGTAPPRQRLRAVRTLTDAGVRTGVLMAPILPGISDSPRALGDVIRAARDAGAAFVGASPLRLSPGTREHFLAHLGADWPDLAAEYERLFRGRASLPSQYVTSLHARVRQLRQQHEVADRPHRFITPEPEPLQLGLPLAS